MAEHFDPDDARAYRYLADEVIKWLNPPDGDEAEESLLAEAVKRAAQFIESLPCTCVPGEAEFYGEPCARCAALGRVENRAEER